MWAHDGLMAGFLHFDFCALLLAAKPDILMVCLHLVWCLLDCIIRGMGCLHRSSCSMRACIWSDACWLHYAMVGCISSDSTRLHAACELAMVASGGNRHDLHARGIRWYHWPCDRRLEGVLRGSRAMDAMDAMLRFCCALELAISLTASDWAHHVASRGMQNVDAMV